jgi:hypothetical protein
MGGGYLSWSMCGEFMMVLFGFSGKRLFSTIKDY